MNTNQALKIINNELISEDGMLMKIAMNEGINLQSYELVKKALDTIENHFKNETSVPKALACAFIDISSVFERSINYYSEREQELIEDMRDYM